MTELTSPGRTRTRQERRERGAGISWLRSLLLRLFLWALLVENDRVVGEELKGQKAEKFDCPCIKETITVFVDWEDLPP